MQNSILNVHDLPTRRFGSFRRDSLSILTHSSMQKALQLLLGSPGMLVQSMYFEGNPNTWPHQDTYYLDSENIGSMVAAWVLFWNSRTIHGSLPTSQPQYSRSSFTAHYIPEGHRFLQFQSRIKTFQSQLVNDMRVNHPKDQDRLKNRIVMGLETAFPGPYEALKKAAIKIVTH